ncbi:MAG: cupredoxin domain-containing protein [Gemmatimonadetes bacterium]|nr:cupredoxin domain-containing protein [Gemmatimonadota bacterium]MBP6670010.1 cupredoxin domain-containing protein [Gemmatimonadales bacterium]MBK6779352.1 cupredoxin domain-containing protein [Gemmatimonadota bacterium]MBK7348335.1 cupredoxin domain-containing protein [Gemmatimonadota bacterium]MBK7713905.1 cupredoxin domain-containing protein [Gemmatimonadota bacterium]
MSAKLALLVGSALTLAAGTTPGDPPAGRVIVVKMTDVSATEYRYEPASVTVTAGDTVRFTQTGVMPHNVDFKAAPPAATLGVAKTGPFLTKAGQTYDLVIDGRFPAGAYQFACTPHEALGMKGTLTVQP